MAAAFLYRWLGEVAEIYLGPFRPFERRGVAAFCPGQITDARPYLAEVQAGLGRVGDRRALLLWGLLDSGFPWADLERFQRAFPRHETIELPAAGHFFFEDAPQRVIEAVRDFVVGARRD